MLMFELLKFPIRQYVDYFWLFQLFANRVGQSCDVTPGLSIVVMCDIVTISCCHTVISNHILWLVMILGWGGRQSRWSTRSAYDLTSWGIWIKDEWRQLPIHQCFPTQTAGDKEQKEVSVVKVFNLNYFNLISSLFPSPESSWRILKEVWLFQNFLSRTILVRRDWQLLDFVF